MSFCPLSLKVASASSISERSEIPVEIITGLPVFATLSRRGILVISGEAILYAGTPSDSSKSTAVESKGLENDVKILVQKKMALQDENERLRDELNKDFMEGADTQMETDDLIDINKQLNEKIQELTQKVADIRKINKNENEKLQKELKEIKTKYESTNRDALKNEEKVRKNAEKLQKDKEKELE